MSTKVTDNLSKYLLLGGGLMAGYFLVHWLADRKPAPSSKAIPLETTLTLLKEIKYQIYASCIAFAEGVNAKLKANYPPKDLEVFLRTELAKTYDLKEDLILSKHMVSRDEYEIALKKYKNNAQVVADQAEILKVLEETVKGQVDLTVPAAATQRFGRMQLLGLYRTVCEEIGVKVWQKLLDNKRNNPGFDSKNDQHFKAAIRELGIYEFKVQFLREKGFRDEWGCPNLVFLKLLEEAKRQNAEVKAEATYIEKGYESIISKVSHDLDSFDRVKIIRLMEDTITENKNKGKASVPAPAPVPVARPQPVQIAPPQPKKPAVVAKPKKEEEEFDLEKMMMEELMSRSQEAPKEEVKVEKKEEVPVAHSHPVEIKQEEPRVVEIEESVVIEPVEVKVQPVPEPIPEIESKIQAINEPVAQEQEVVAEPVDQQPEILAEPVPQHPEPVPHHAEPVHEEIHPHIEPEAHHEPVEVHHEPVEVHYEPVEVHHEPVEVHHEPVEVAHHEPVEVHHEPVHEPVEAAHEPVHVHHEEEHVNNHHHHDHEHQHEEIQQALPTEEEIIAHVNKEEHHE